MEPGMENEITCVADIASYAVGGFQEWGLFGDVSVHAFDNLLIFNYTQAAQFANRWNTFERLCRGLIINRDTGEIVARPFDKFFNYDPSNPPAGNLLRVTEKVDGSLGILYRKGKDVRISTRGSFFSQQAEWATKFLNEHYDVSDFLKYPFRDWTFLFEIVYPANRVIVNYGEREELVLLAVRNRFTGEYCSPEGVHDFARRYGFGRPQVYNFESVWDILTAAEKIGIDQEGWVAEYSDGSRWKIKGLRYLELHKIVCGLSFKNTLKAHEAGTLDTLRSVLPDEYRLWVDEWVKDIDDTIDWYNRRVTEAFEKAPKTSRKDFAIYVTKNYTSLSPYLFAMYDNRPILPLIYKNGFDKIDRVTNISEDG